MLRAEWTKFRTVRGWVIGIVVAALVTVLVGLLSAAGARIACSNGARPVPRPPASSPPGRARAARR